MSDFHNFYLAFAGLVAIQPEAIWHPTQGREMENLAELEDVRIGTDEWLERLDTFADEAWEFAADLLQQRLEKELSVSPDIAHQMALVELDQVTEDELAEVREVIVSALARRVRSVSIQERLS